MFDSFVKLMFSVCSSAHTVDRRQVGVLGTREKEHAISCLQNCPLLEDVAEWSHWELVFQPEMGPLKDFVQKHGGIHNLSVTGGEWRQNVLCIMKLFHPGYQFTKAFRW